MRLRRLIPDALAGTRSLDGGGERVDIDLRRGDPAFESLDLYERSHWRRYEFASGQVPDFAVVADFACGTGYGAVMLARRAARVVGVDIDRDVVDAARRRYRKNCAVAFMAADLRDLRFEREFDVIVSFETVEHFDEDTIPTLFRSFARALRSGGMLIFSVPYRQQRSPEALQLGFHKTFLIDEGRLEPWLIESGFTEIVFRYQDYATHEIRDEREGADFIVGTARLTGD